jgi:hypothetical protein
MSRAASAKERHHAQALRLFEGLGAGLEGMPSFRLTSGEALIPTGEPNRFKLENKRAFFDAIAKQADA